MPASADAMTHESLSCAADASPQRHAGRPRARLPARPAGAAVAAPGVAPAGSCSRQPSGSANLLANRLKPVESE